MTAPDYDESATASQRTAVAWVRACLAQDVEAIQVIGGSVDGLELCAKVTGIAVELGEKLCGSREALDDVLARWQERPDVD